MQVGSPLHVQVRVLLLSSAITGPSCKICTVHTLELHYGQSIPSFLEGFLHLRGCLRPAVPMRQCDIASQSESIGGKRAGNDTVQHEVESGAV